MRNLFIAGTLLLFADAARADYPYNAGAFEMTGSSPREFLIGKWKPKREGQTQVIEFMRGGKLTASMGGQVLMTGTYRFAHDHAIEVQMEMGGQKHRVRLGIAFKGGELVTCQEERHNVTERFTRVR